ncbi:MAG: hypothetical protein ACM336_08180 [Acidobacteriota bacterium]
MQEAGPKEVASVREELARILASREFRSSKRSQDFLRYVVEAALDGRASSLKERTIGIDVFGRPPEYDPSGDATVRVKAGEVRKRLGLYYAGEGARSEVRIELPGGAYVPEFVHTPQNGKVPEPPPPARSRAAPALLVVGLLAAAALLLGIRERRDNSAMHRFWGPVLEGGAPVSLCASFVPVWGLRDPAASAAARREDFVPLADQFVAGGDLVAVSEIGSMLTRMKRPFQLRMGNEVSFEDLRAGPSILVGYSYTRWREISRQMRFFIDTSRRPMGITDNGAPTKWTLASLPPDRRTTEDYAIVSRVFHPYMRAMLVEVAGITQYGTAAAADLVTSPDQLSEALRNAPPGWQTKNLQLVLHVKVISGAPAPPRLVASHFW